MGPGTAAGVPITSNAERGIYQRAGRPLILRPLAVRESDRQRGGAHALRPPWAHRPTHGPHTGRTGPRFLMRKPVEKLRGRENMMAAFIRRLARLGLVQLMVPTQRE
jgi:hypothetical protein